MTGEDINARVAAHACVVCGAPILDWQVGLIAGEGFPFTECRQHRGVHRGRQPKKFDRQAERDAGVEILKKLGA